MKKLLFILMIALVACGEDDKVDPVVAAPSIDTVAIFELHGNGVGYNVLVKATVKDLSGVVIKTWSKTVLYEAEYTVSTPKVVTLSIPGVPSTGEYKYEVSTSYIKNNISTGGSSGGQGLVSFSVYPGLSNAVYYMFSATAITL